MLSPQSLLQGLAALIDNPAFQLVGWTDVRKSNISDNSDYVGLPIVSPSYTG